MKVVSSDKDNVNLSLSYDEVYVLLQCVAEADSRMDDTEIDAIMGVKRTELSLLADELQAIKVKMRSR